jgi:hypothetical protein
MGLEVVLFLTHLRGHGWYCNKKSVSQEESTTNVLVSVLCDIGEFRIKMQRHKGSHLILCLVSMKQSQLCRDVIAQKV